MEVDTDKLVAAILAASMVKKEGSDRPLDYVVAYERLVKIMSRRNERAEAAKGGVK